MFKAFLSQRTPVPLRALIVVILSTALPVSSCRPELVFDGGSGEAAIRVADIQGEHPDDSEPALGELVFLRSVIVTVFDSYAEPEQSRVQRGDEYVCVQDVGYTGGLVVQDVAGGPLSGVSLFNPTLVPAHQSLGPGDLVDIRGEYLEFCLAGEDFHADSYCQAPNSNRLTQLGSATAIKVGESSPPEPSVIVSTVLDSADTAEPYEGVLVQINEDLSITRCRPTDPQNRPNCCVGDYDRYGNLMASNVQITNEFYSIPEGTTCLSSITGVVSWFGHQSECGEYSISPRGPADIVVPPECLPTL